MMLAWARDGELNSDPPMPTQLRNRHADNWRRKQLPRAGVRADQTGARLPPVPAARLQHPRRMGNRLHRPQPPQARPRVDSIRRSAPSGLASQVPPLPQHRRSHAKHSRRDYVHRLLVFRIIRVPTTLAGTPATTVPDATSDKRTEQAPTTAPRRILTPGPTNARVAIQHSASMLIGDATSGNEMSEWSCVPAQR
jgi:hypothetical protein